MRYTLVVSEIKELQSQIFFEVGQLKLLRIDEHYSDSYLGRDDFFRFFQKKS